MNLLQQLEQEQVDKLAASRPIPEFQPGDTLRVGVKVVEGERERIQVFEGVCIGRKNAGVNSNFTLRKISYGEGVERIFPLYLPRITSIDVVRRGVVRRAKLYYLRGLTGERAPVHDPKPNRLPRWPARSKKPANRSDRSHGPAAHPLRQDLGKPRHRP